MKITISFKNLEHTPALDTKIRQKSHKLDKYLGGNTDIQWTCFIQDGLHVADVKLTGPSFQYSAKAGTESLYKTLDQVINKIEKQLQKKKDKWKNKLHKKGSHSKTAHLNEDEKETDPDDEFFEDVG